MAATPKAIKSGKTEPTSLASESAPAGNIPGIVWTTDLEQRFTSLVGAGLQTLNIRTEEYLGCSVQTLFRLSGRASHAADPYTRAASGESCTCEIAMLDHDCFARLAPLRNAQGEIVGVIGVALDNTEQMVSQRSLALSEQSYRLLTEDAPYSICRCTATGNLLQVNRAMIEMLGYSETDLLLSNLQWSVFADPEDYGELLRKLSGNAPCQGFECRWRRNDGQEVMVSLGGRSTYDAAGEISYLDVVAENISERKQLEEQLRQAQKMQAVGQLAGGVAHDFNNLLTVIRGQVEVMSEEMLVSDPLRCRLDEVGRAAERATTLTRQLLAFSRRQVLQTKVLDLNSVIANMSQMLGRLIGENIELTFVPDPHLWPVRVDPGQIEQVLMNLAVNARDAMPKGGKLVIETKNVGARLGRRSGTPEPEPLDHVRLTVRDSGHGMSEETKARIFEPFFTTKQVGQGTGLGLSTVYGVVKQSGGSIRVESQPGTGAAFKIYLPHTTSNFEELPKTVQPPTRKGTETVLLAEDDDSIRQMIAGFLRSQGYHVLPASNGADAKRLLEAHGLGIQLLLSDFVMPRMSGRELAAELRKIHPELKVVFVSGYAGDLQAELEDAHFLQKPFSLQHLAATIREALDGQIQC